MKKSVLIFLMCLVAICSACSTSKVSNKKTIVVISDTHLFDAESLLRKPSPSFDTLSATNDCMMEYSKQILDNIFQQINGIKPDILLIPGDLSNNGERVNHELMVERYLKPLQAAGTSIYVCPGNHDINNSNAMSFLGEASSIESVTPEMFASIYSKFGFSSAFSRDTESLSYAAKLDDSLALISLDVCHYTPGLAQQEWLGGSVKSGTLVWMEQQVKQLKNDGCEVFVMMHHSLFEHWNGENELLPGFVLDNSSEVADKCVELGVKFVFTGHFHSQDITQYGEEPLFDISTGSATSTACPIRIITLDNECKIMSMCDTNLNNWSPEFAQGNFVSFSDSYVTNWINYYIGLISLPITPNGEFINLLSRAMVAHYRGDEVLSDSDAAIIDTFSSIAPAVAPLLNNALRNGLYKDLNPQDRKITFNYSRGVIIK